MKIVMLVVTAIGMIVIPLFLYVLNIQKPDIQYTLSEPLKLGQGEMGKLWQQLEVRNEGSVRAEDILVKVNTKISNYEISKYSEGDKTDIFTDSDPFELRYATLVPKGRFTVTLGTLQKQVVLDDISVSHSRGIGVEAFSRSQKFINALLLLVLFLVIAFNVIAGLRNLSVSQIELSFITYLPTKILRKKKPFFVPREAWENVREMAIERLLKHQIFGFPGSTECYKILCEEIPPYLNKEDWEKLRKIAISRLEENMSYTINDSYDDKGLLTLIRLNRPQHMPENKWLKLRKFANRRYIKLRQDDLLLASIETVSLVLKEERPKELEEEIWQDFIKYTRGKLFERIESEIIYSEEPMETLDDEYLSLLDPQQSSIIRKDAYNKQIGRIPDVLDHVEAREFLERDRPKWISEEDYKKYKTTAQKALDLNEHLDKCTKKEETLSKKEAELEAKSHEFADKLSKITKQLEIVDACLSDPKILDKIEDYNNCFAPGNYANLKKIAKLANEYRSRETKPRSGI